MSARVAVVTGAARGLGEVIAGRLHTAGYIVVVTDLSAEAADAVAGKLDPDRSTALGLALDVREKESFERVLAEVTGRWGGADVLVNNAATARIEPVLEISPESFAAVVSTTLTGVFFGCQVFGAHFAARGQGRIVNVGSLAGQNGGSATGAHYAAAKGGVGTLTKVFGRDLAASGVTVNAVSPGPLDLPSVREAVPSEALAAIVKSIPAGQLVSPEFVADTVVLLAAEHAGTVTGACWDINGGLYLR
ncbi:SDR family NAD(P)-dependent oxidoreductase [Amycolatopsis jejuensis]|uniref:SDR family NAD(P)-dependent oxidoreductase n=1 Tax=Amycolatopsis jejuensis TaxID=330084 RepID=UPI000524C2B3|nr:SDR family oxidoreductase [Amycolatopsis jejuensis]